jgi:cardiolipin synthase
MVEWTTGYLLLEGLAIALAAEAIYKARTAQGAIAWSLSLVALPLLSIPLYFLFGGRRFHGYVNARKRGNLALRLQAASLTRELQPYQSSRQLDVLEKIARMPSTGGNDVELLVNAEQTFLRMFEAVEAAQDYVLVQFYIVRDDAIGRQFQELLIKKVRQGVRVYFLYDEVGSVHLSKHYADRLRDAGVHVHPFSSTKRWYNRIQINFRNHRKLVLVDGRIAFVGGINLGDEYLGKDKSLGPWRDTHVAVEGPAAMCAQIAFVEDWLWVTDKMPELCWQPLELEQRANQRVLVLATGPADALESCELAFLHLFAQAKERLWIVSPYFVPDLTIMHSLELAALRGVDVRILLPLRADNLLVHWSAYAFFSDAMRCGIRFYRYNEGFLHQKVMLIDDHIGWVGSANLDNRSFRLNFELNVVVEDALFCQQLEAMLESDFAVSKEVPLGEWAHRSLFFRWWVKCVRLLAPLL